MNYEIIQGNNLDLLAQMADNSVDAIVTDPPYGMSKLKVKTVQEVITAWLKGEDPKVKGSGFMGASWDSFVPSPTLWRECLRVLKPGGHLAAFASSRTLDLMGLSLRLAGFELRDTLEVLGWHYGSGFPKSLDISKAIDDEKGLKREVLGYTENARPNRVGKETKLSGKQTIGGEITQPACGLSEQWQGWGTNLKPSYEPILLCRKEPEGTIAQTVEKYGTGGVNIDACRVATGESLGRPFGGGNDVYGKMNMERGTRTGDDLTGRWPPNTLLLHHPLCDESKCDPFCVTLQLADKAKFFPQFFYGAKASRSEREKGCESLPLKTSAELTNRKEGSAGLENPRASTTTNRKNHHPTVKPLDLMRWLCKLVTPPNGIILDPFSGSGSTIIAAVQEGFQGLGFELNPEYVTIANARLKEIEK